MSKLTRTDVALAKVGLAALIDEATGYQEKRKPDELRSMMRGYVGEPEHGFPTAYFAELDRLYGGRLTGMGASNVGLQIAEAFSEIYIYLPLADESEKEAINSADVKIRCAAIAKFVNDHSSTDKFKKQVDAVTRLMKASKSLSQFNNLYSQWAENPL